MSNLPHVFFLPWKGKQYGRSRLGRLLVLGESHHGNDPAPNWTVEVVEEYIANKDSQPWFRTFTNIGLAVAGSAYWELGRLEFWNSVAFYNYVQEPVPGPRQAPTHEMFARSEPGFFEVVSALRPSHILALGYRLWGQMPPFESECDALYVGGKRADCGYYGSTNRVHRALALAIYHPSAGFSAAQWHPLITKFLLQRPEPGYRNLGPI
jgi:hypothetical protein